jgi:hypothetical protein
MRRFQWMAGDRKSYVMTVEPLTQELFDQYIRPNIPNPAMHDVAEYQRPTGPLDICLVTSDTVSRPVFYQFVNRGCLPPEDGLVRLIPLD